MRLCLRTGWTWNDLLETPAAVVALFVDELNEQSRQASQQSAQAQAVRPRRRR